MFQRPCWWSLSCLARLGGIAIVCLGLVGLHWSSTTLDDLQQATGSVKPKATGTPTHEQEKSRVSASSTAPVDDSRSAAAAASQLSPSVHNAKANERPSIGVAPASSASNCKGDAFFDMKGMAYSFKKQDRASLNGSKIAVLFRGEAFRTKSWRPAPKERRLANQIEASESHVNQFLRGLRDAGVKIDIYLHAWLTEEWMRQDGIPMLQNAYHQWGNVISRFLDRKPSSQGHGVQDAINFLKNHSRSRNGAALPYDVVVLMRFDLVFTSFATPPADSPFAMARILWPMRDCPTCWKNEGIVHDTVIWIPKRYFGRFFDEVVGQYGCFEAVPKNHRAGSGHMCSPKLAQKKPPVLQGFWFDGCFGVRVPHPLYYLVEGPREKSLKK